MRKMFRRMLQTDWLYYGLSIAVGLGIVMFNQGVHQVNNNHLAASQIYDSASEQNGINLMANMSASDLRQLARQVLQR